MGKLGERKLEVEERGRQTQAKIETRQRTTGATRRKKRRPYGAREREAKVLETGGQMRRNRETIQCSKHLLSTYWVLKSRGQGGHSESLIG